MSRPLWRYILFFFALYFHTSFAHLFTNQFAVKLSLDADPSVIAHRHGLSYIGQIGSLRGYHLYEHPKIRKRSVKPHTGNFKLRDEPQVEAVWQQQEKKRVKRNVKQTFPDPLFAQQWYLNGGADEGLDMNVGPAWARGYTGKGVVVSILDDGIQINHPDLKDNYDPEASYDINDNDSDPMPRDDGDNKHGTRCAGEVAAQAFNSYCGVGVAYNASIGGVRMLDGVVNDAVEARALSLNPDHIDIYSASWGPEDDGKTVDGPGPLATRAFLNGITYGRKGKGNIFVWASGNGGRHTDSCNCDGYTNSVYTLSISSATQAGFKPWYLEECSSTIATTYSSGTLGRDKSVASVDMDSKLREENLCTTEHTGTSASAPIAAGMCALALEANPSLTWRDMQHIVVMSANPRPLSKEQGWITNGANRKVSHKFGFGLMDGNNMVTLAEQWTNVPDQHVCKTQEAVEERKIMNPVEVQLNVSGCSDVRYLEHVQCRLSISFSPRGDLQLVLISPQGTRSTILQPRPNDLVSSSFDDWPFLSVHFWGEDPIGTWTLDITDTAKTNRPDPRPGILHKWQLIFFGTKTNPVKLIPPSLQLFNRIDLSNEIPVESSYNYSKEMVTNEGCDPSCDKDGCYGPGPDKCLTCTKYRIDGYCVGECPEEGFFRSGSKCERCHDNCLTCAGSGPQNCVTCAPHLFLISDLGLCVTTCPQTYYEDADFKRCLSCSDNCGSCRESPEKCYSCNLPLLLYNDSCVVTCPTGTFHNLHKRCESCHNSCSGGCSGSKTSDCLALLTKGEICTRNCTSCPPGLYLFKSTCSQVCPSGYYTARDKCKPCWSGCASCTGSRRDECVSCVSGWYLAEGQCRLHCPRNMFSKPPGCQRCHHFCSTCNGGGVHGCTGCSLGRYLDEDAALCLPCRTDCAACSGPQACTACGSASSLRDGHCLPRHLMPPPRHPSHNTSDGENVHLSPAGKRRTSSSEESPSYVSLKQFTHGNKYSPFFLVTIIVCIACIAILVLVILLVTTMQMFWCKKDRVRAYTLGAPVDIQSGRTTRLLKPKGIAFSNKPTITIS